MMNSFDSIALFFRKGSNGRGHFVFVTNLAPCSGVSIHLWPEKHHSPVQNEVPASKKIVEVTSKMVQIPAGPAPKQVIFQIVHLIIIIFLHSVSNPFVWGIWVDITPVIFVMWRSNWGQLKSLSYCLLLLLTAMSMPYFCSVLGQSMNMILAFFRLYRWILNILLEKLALLCCGILHSCPCIFFHLLCLPAFFNVNLRSWSASIS